MIILLIIIPLVDQNLKVLLSLIHISHDLFFVDLSKRRMVVRDLLQGGQSSEWDGIILDLRLETVDDVTNLIRVIGNNTTEIAVGGTYEVLACGV